MANWPCRNTSCNSYGRPHPFCECAAPMAEGGEAHFCSQDRAHDAGCQYFPDGGDVIDPDNIEVDQQPQEIPEDQIEPDQSAVPTATNAEPEAIPEDQIEVDPEPEEDEGVHTTTPPPDQRVAQDLGTEHALGLGAAKGVPILGPIGATAGRAAAAAMSQITPDSLLNPDWRGKNFSETYDQLEQQEKNAEAQHPIATTVGEGLGATTAFGPAEKAAAAAAKTAGLGKIASGFLKGSISNGLICGADEASKMLLGENPHSIPEAVGATLACAGIGGLFGSAPPIIQKAAAKAKVTARATNVINGIASAAMSSDPIERATMAKTLSKQVPEYFDAKGHALGEKIYDNIFRHGMTAAGGTIGAVHGYTTGGLKEAAIEAGEGLAAGEGINKVTGAVIPSMVLRYMAPQIKKVSTPVVMKILSSNTTEGILGALKHAEDVANGNEMTTSLVDKLFGGASRGVDTTVKNRDSILKWAEGGFGDDMQQSIWDQHAQPVPQGFAEGGEVKRDPQPIHQEGNGVAIHFPEQNILMNAAKARTANYLSSLRPQENPPRLAFDSKPDNRQKTRDYHRAVDVAASPLSVLDKIHDGSITPDHIKHLNAMFPEVSQLMQKRVTERITKAQMDGEKPSYKVRQGLSMLLGTPLSAELTPANIQAAQGVFASQKQQQSQQTSGSAPKTNSGNKKALSKSDQSYLTGSQALEKRQQRQS